MFYLLRTHFLLIHLFNGYNYLKVHGLISQKEGFCFCFVFSNDAPSTKRPWFGISIIGQTVWIQDELRILRLPIDTLLGNYSYHDK